MEDNKRLTGLFASHFHVLPSKMFADAGPEGLGNRFFGRKARRQERGRLPVQEAIGDFSRTQDAVQKAFPKLFIRSPDARDFNDVNASAEDHAKFPKRSSSGHSPTASAARCRAESIALSDSFLSSERWLNKTAQLNPSQRRTNNVDVPGRLPVCQ